MVPCLLTVMLASAASPLTPPCRLPSVVTGNHLLYSASFVRFVRQPFLKVFFYAAIPSYNLTVIHYANLASCSMSTCSLFVNRTVPFNNLASCPLSYIYISAKDIP